VDEARPGRPRTIDDDQIAAVIERTLRSTPADATHWSIRSMAGVTSFSHTTIRRIWTAFGLQPHRSETFKLSSDPLFVDKVRDIVGLYLSPPNNQIERWFAELTRKQLRRGVHTSTSQLERDIRNFIEHHNENPRPY
jgi:hypothetical protein